MDNFNAKNGVWCNPRQAGVHRCRGAIRRHNMLVLRRFYLTEYDGKPIL